MYNSFYLDTNGTNLSIIKVDSMNPFIIIEGNCRYLDTEK